MTVFKYAMKRGFMNPTSLVINCVFPLAVVILMFGDGSGGRGYYMLAMALMFGAFFMSAGVQNDKLQGVITRIMAGPITMRNYLLQNLLAAIVPMLGLIVILCALGMILHDWGLTFAIGLAVCYAFLAITSIGLSFVWSCLFKDKEASTIAFSFIMMFVALISGLMIPLSLLPTPIFYAGALFPAHWATRAIENLVEYGSFTGMYWLSILAMFLFAVAYLLYGGKRRIG